MGFRCLPIVYNTIAVLESSSVPLYIYIFICTILYSAHTDMSLLRSSHHFLIRLTKSLNRRILEIPKLQRALVCYSPCKTAAGSTEQVNFSFPFPHFFFAFYRRPIAIDFSSSFFFSSRAEINSSSFPSIIHYQTLCAFFRKNPYYLIPSCLLSSLVFLVVYF